MTEDTRRASAAFAYQNADGSAGPSGEAEAVIGDDELTVGPIALAWLDADDVAAADHRIAIDVWPGGRLTLSQLGRRFDTFTSALIRVRGRARVAGLLAHAPTAPQAFTGAVLGPGPPRPAELLVYPTHVAVVPNDADPFQVPLGALTDVVVTDDPPAVSLVTADACTMLGQLARRRDAFHAAVVEQRKAQAELLAGYAGQAGFADGRGVARSAIQEFDTLLTRCTAVDRLAGAHTLLATARGGEPRLGFVQLLDRDAESLAAPSALPEDWASFLLVPAGRLVVLELLSGPAAATYIFDGEIEPINRDLQSLHFRRSGLALTEEQAAVAPSNPHRLALRRLEPLQRLRTATRGRLIHTAQWNDALSRALVDRAR